MKTEAFVIDTNTLISAFLFGQSKPALAYDKAKRLGKLLTSQETYDEFCEAFVRPKFDKYISLQTRLAIINEAKDFFVLTKIEGTVTDCRDPKDNKFLELAVAASASCLITGDKDLLVLHPFRGIPILNATDFLTRF